MSKPYDATLKQIIDRFAADWAGFLCEQLCLPSGTKAVPLDADLSTVTSPQSDKLFQLSGAASGLIHLELLSSWADDLPDRCLLYNVLGQHRYGGPVRTLIVLLRREAYSSNLIGLVAREDERGEYLRFRYEVVKLWEQPLDQLIRGPLGTVPLALLTDEAQSQLPTLIREIDQRARKETKSGRKNAEILTACDLLLGLRYNPDQVAQFFKGVRGMRDSSTYMAILEEGRIDQAREMIQQLGAKRFGKLKRNDLKSLRAITDLDRLGRIVDRLLDAADWADLLSTP
jgi:hypothetical protein